LACLGAARVCPRVERRRIGEICGSSQGGNFPDLVPGLDLNYLKKFRIYLTAAGFTGNEYGESHPIG
jgi:hypothetical protein